MVLLLLSRVRVYHKCCLRSHLRRGLGGTRETILGTLYGLVSSFIQILAKCRQQTQLCVAPRDPAQVPFAVVTLGFINRDLGLTRGSSFCFRVGSCWSEGATLTYTEKQNRSNY